MIIIERKYTTNVRLEENDMIMVGPYDQLAVVRGKVKRNRIFELRKGETLKQLLDMPADLPATLIRRTYK